MSWQQSSQVTELNDAPHVRADRMTFSDEGSANEMYRVSVSPGEGTNARQAALKHVREIHRPGASRRGSGPGRGQDAQHNEIGTEHILLALIREGGVAAQALESLGITEEAARQQVEEVVGPGQPGPQWGHLPFTPRAKKILQLSRREAITLGHVCIGTEHILLGLVREDDGVAMGVLNGLGVDANRVRQQVIQLVSARRVQEEPGTGRSAGRG
jgi:hypothetical protein